jgi:hypothetical protein
VYVRGLEEKVDDPVDGLKSAELLLDILI